MGFKVYRRYLDPHWFNHNYPNSRLTVAQEYRQYGIVFSPIASFHEKGMGRGVFESTARKRLKEKMSYNKNEPLSNTNHPTIFFKNDMFNTTKGFNNFVWDEYTGKRADKKDVSERPQDKYKCFPNLYEYAVMVPLRWHPPGENFTGRQFRQFTGRR